MVLLWNKRIVRANPWEPDYFGLFTLKQGLVHFYFRDRHSLCVLVQNSEEVRTILSAQDGSHVPLPSRWALDVHEGIGYLFMDTDKIIDLETECETTALFEDTKERYRKLVKPSEYYVYTPFQLGEYRIEHKGECGYLCRKNGQKKWTFNGRAYLYTDILRWKDRIFFGTAGNGGYFYVLGIDDGTVIAAIKTGGTTCIVQDDHLCYVLSNDPQAKLICVDLRDGKIIQEVKLPGKATSDSRLQLLDGKLHGITFVYKKCILDTIVWSCVEI